MLKTLVWLRVVEDKLTKDMGLTLRKRCLKEVELSAKEMIQKFVFKVKSAGKQAKVRSRGKMCFKGSLKEGRKVNTVLEGRGKGGNRRLKEEFEGKKEQRWKVKQALKDE